MNPCGTDIEVLPVLEDNFAYLIHGPAGTVLVDAPDAGPIRRRLEDRKRRLTHILVTHDHQDHIGGLAALKEWSGAVVIAPAGSRVPQADREARGGERLDVAGLGLDVIWTPGHCAAHASFHLPAAAAVFTGDCLFGAGCGRLFGNPPEIMWNSLQRLAALPDATRVYFGHEYTVSNLRFALTVEPGNAALARRLAAAEAATPTSPSTIALEKATNPFLRAGNVDLFAELRRRKDRF